MSNQFRYASAPGPYVAHMLQFNLSEAISVDSRIADNTVNSNSKHLETSRSSLGVREVVSSNLAVPTKNDRAFDQFGSPVQLAPHNSTWELYSNECLGRSLFGELTAYRRPLLSPC
jgi:hypothetical protein